MKDLNLVEAKMNFIRAWQSLPEYGVSLFVVRYNLPEYGVSLFVVRYNPPGYGGSASS